MVGDGRSEDLISTTQRGYPAQSYPIGGDHSELESRYR